MGGAPQGIGGSRGAEGRIVTDPVASGILSRYQRYGWSEPEGEWGFVQSAGRTMLRAALGAGDADALHSLLADSFFSLCGGIGSNTEPTPEVVGRVGWSWALSVAPWKDLARRGAVDVGDVLTPVMHGRVVASLDTPRHDHYAHQIMRYLPDGGTLLEIGGGYGGVARQLYARGSVVRVVLCDLPETLYLAWYYLSETTGLRIAWWDDDPGADVVLVPDFDLRAWAGKPDMMFAAHSLSEMPHDVARGYLAWASEQGVQYIYSDNAAWVTPAPPGGERNLCELYPEVSMGDLVPPGPYVERWRRQIHWDLPEPRYVEAFYERVEP